MRLFLIFVQDREQEPKMEGDSTRIIMEGLKQIFSTMKNRGRVEPKIDIFDFLQLAPPSFDVILVDSFQVQQWIQGMEKIYKVYECLDNDKVKVTAYIL
jgi:spermidine synthase